MLILRNSRPVSVGYDGIAFNTVFKGNKQVITEIFPCCVTQQAHDVFLLQDCPRRVVEIDEKASLGFQTGCLRLQRERRSFKQKFRLTVQLSEQSQAYTLV